MVNELEELDPVAVAVRPGSRRPDGWVPQQLQPPNELHQGLEPSGTGSGIGRPT